MKVKIEIEFDDVNYEEIEEIAELFEFELEDEEELLYLEEEDEIFELLDEEDLDNLMRNKPWEVPEPKHIARGEWIELYDTLDPR